MAIQKKSSIQQLAIIMLAVGAVVFAVCVGDVAMAQESNTPTFNENAPTMPVDESGTTETNTGADDEAKSVSKAKGLNLLTLLTRGGWFMVPLGLLSILVVAISIERMLALREEKILPKPLVRELGNLSRNPDGFDPRMAFQSCQAHPSAASRVLRVMLLKAGRPQMEVENAIAEAAEREATRLQSTVSWLVLAAAVAPLIGLLGTVWGMIQAFYDTTQLVAGQNKAEVLAQGIYTALVTTLSGLIIAIPSAVLAHYYDNRIVGWFHKIEELAASLTPMLEPYEGKMRASDYAAPTPGESDRRTKEPIPTASTIPSPPSENGDSVREQAPVAVVPPPSKRPR